MSTHLPTLDEPTKADSETRHVMPVDALAQTHALVTRTGVAVGSLMILTSLGTWVLKATFGIPGTLLTVLGSALIGLSVWTKVSVKAGPVHIELEKDSEQKRRFALVVLIVFGVAGESVFLYHHAVRQNEPGDPPSIEEQGVGLGFTDSLPTIGEISLSDIEPECELADELKWDNLVAAQFELGTAELNQPSVHFLAEVADVLSEYSDCYVHIVGHADSTPLRSHRKYRGNLGLSLARAQSVAIFLADSGVDPGHIEIIGVGDRYARERSGAAATRRVVEIFLKQKSAYETELTR